MNVNPALSVEVQLGCLMEFMIHILVDGRYDAVTLQQKLGALDMCASAPAIRTVIRKLPFYQLDTADSSVFLCDSHRGCQGDDADSLFSRLLDLLGAGRHFPLGSAVYDRYLL